MMSIIAVLIYGSVARGDNNPLSDVDMLSVVTERPARKVEKMNMNMSYYNREDLLLAASAGDLFTYHLALEAYYIYDADNFENKLKSAFTKAVSYENDVFQASALGWFLVKYNKYGNFPLLNRRAAWCVRTILIAKSISLGRPSFSAGTLNDLFASDEANEIMKMKNYPELNTALPDLLSKFLRDYGDQTAQRLIDAPLHEHLQVFRQSKSKIAQSTASVLMQGASLYE